MISICIPIYNKDVTRLVKELHKQADEQDIPFEILLIDDASTELQAKQRNRELLNLHNITYEELPENQGRSAVRNLFVSKASYPYLIFIDNDARVYTSDFVSKYLRQRTPGVICYGGCEYDQVVDDEFRLRWLFGVNREAISIAKRQENPDMYFSTFNFLIDKRVLLLESFNESIKGYGYEDVLFRINVLKQGYHITQLDNPLVHEGLMSGSEFLKNVRFSLEKLLLLLSHTEDKASLVNSIKLLTVYNRIKKMKLVKLVSFLFCTLQKYLIQNLEGKNPRLFLFDLYKLGYICNQEIQYKNVDS